VDNLYFISYSSVDGGEYAFKIGKALEAYDPPFPVWLDKVKLRPGEDWDDQIEEAIRNSECLLFIVTPDSLSPKSVCKLEWTAALKYKKSVIPLIFALDLDIPLRLELLHRIDFTTSLETGIITLCNHLLWLKTPGGVLRSLQDRLEDQKRELRKAQSQDNPGKQAALQDAIVSLENQISEILRSIPVSETPETNGMVALASNQRTILEILNQQPGGLSSIRYGYIEKKLKDRGIKTRTIELTLNELENLSLIHHQHQISGSEVQHFYSITEKGRQFLKRLSLGLNTLNYGM
jgi:hypothetical protein